MPTLLQPGDPAPYFRQRSFANPRYVFDTAAGRYIVLCFYASATDAHALAALAAVRARARFFDDVQACFFGISTDQGDESAARVADSYPGYRFIWDFDQRVSRLYGATPATQGGGRLWVVLDPTLRVLRLFPFQQDRGDIPALLRYLDALPPCARFAGIELQAPILYLPNVFEPELCQRLIGMYEAAGGEETGFMREVNGKTMSVSDHAHKRRRDYVIEDERMITQIQARFRRRVVPEIQKVHQFKVTRMERYIVACYAAEEGGHFRPHRDNTTKGTAHRRFAASVNLNEDFDGGELSFPEYGARAYKPPPGGAVVFSCSLLHAVSKVTRGKRYACLPFLYDEPAAQLRARNNAFVAQGLAYRPAEPSDPTLVKSRPP